MTLITRLDLGMLIWHCFLTIFSLAFLVSATEHEALFELQWSHPLFNGSIMDPILEQHGDSAYSSKATDPCGYLLIEWSM